LTLAVIASLVIAGICYGLAMARPDLPAARRVVMRVNGEPVTETEFNSFISQAPEQMRAFYASPPGREALARELVKLKALEQQAIRLGIDNDPEVANRLGLMRANVLASAALRKIVTAPSQNRIRQEYDKEKRNFETVELQHIVIAYRGSRFVPKAGGSAPAAGEALKKAQSLVRRLRAGADFAAVAREESDDLNTANSGGHLGPVSAGALPLDLDAAAMKLKPGEISDPVMSEFGIHIFKAGSRGSVEMTPEVQRALSASIQQKEVQAAVERLASQAKVELEPRFFGQSSLPKPQKRPGS
jgi:peptidyl-prolyl cis-trans isomerase C